MSFNSVLERTAQSTTSWSCPWFRIIFVGCVIAIILGVAAQDLLGGLTAAGGGFLLGLVIHERDHEVTSCSR